MLEIMLSTRQLLNETRITENSIDLLNEKLELLKLIEYQQQEDLNRIETDISQLRNIVTVKRNPVVWFVNAFL